MSPLVALMLVAFGMVLVAALLVWTLLSPPRRAWREADLERSEPNLTNDDVRGARVKPSTSRRHDEAFARFLQTDPDDR